jgi:hypothetical protein
MGIPPINQISRRVALILEPTAAWGTDRVINRDFADIADY